MKYLLRAIGILAIVVALYIMAGEQLVGSSGSAYVNAPLSAVRAPISGQADFSRLSVGLPVATNETLGTVGARRGQTDRTLDYRRDLAVARAEFNALTAIDADAITEQTDFDRELAARAARVEALESLLDTQEAAQSGAVSAMLNAPGNGIVWSVPANAPGHVVEGDTLAWIARCDRAYVHASVDERLYNRLSPGDEAQFRAADGTVIEVTVNMLGGTGPRTLVETLAIEPTDRQADGFTVLLSAPALQTANCMLGQTGRVVFTRGPLAIIEDWRARIGI